MTRALILAAGRGTRLQPLTNNKPKCLVTLFGQSLLEQQVQTLKKCGIEDIHIATGFCSEQIKALGFNISFNPYFEKTNMVATFFSTKEFIQKEDDLIISYGDIIYECKNLKALLECKDEIALMIDSKWKDLWSFRFENPLDDAETLIMDNNEYILEVGKKTDNYEYIQGQYTGLIKIRADKLKDLILFYEQLDRNILYAGKDFDNMYMTSFLQLLIDAGWKVKAVLVKNGWLEVDSVDDLESYNRLANDGKLDMLYKVDN